ncbi:helix-turn-helix domain-containing protein [Aminobacterium mobile]|uniref:helix-turn-helix domain-containing protein n=1 Tax=Aminobacterium mobile TaxID=81467 RepID=UPI000466E69E|nr:helix-turn-helix domain-containing protein [Aminobacterium mobile]
MKKERRQITLEELGRAVRERREQRGLNLDDVADLTKIRAQFLENIEEGRYEDFPGIVYVRGFVRTYLRIIEAEDLWEYYKPLLYDMEKQEGEDSLIGACTPPAKGFRLASRFWVILVLVLAVVGTGWYVWYTWNEKGFHMEQGMQGEGKESSQSYQNEKAPSEIISPDIMLFSKDIPSLGIQSAVSQPENPLFSSPDVVLPQEPQKPAEPKLPKLEIVSTGKCWIQIRDGNATIYQGILSKGQTYSLEVTGRVVVTYGRPNDVRITWNGEELGHVGNGGRVERYFYSKDGKMGKVKE